MPMSELDRPTRVDPWLADRGWLNREFTEIIRFNWPSQRGPVLVSGRPARGLALAEPTRMPQPCASAGPPACPSPTHAARAQARQRAPPAKRKSSRAEESAEWKVVGS